MAMTVQFAQKRPILVIPKPALSARNLLLASSEAADSWRDNAARRNDNSFGFFNYTTTGMVRGLTGYPSDV
jgi:hypothetical protein